jgi:hypothetical protein
LPADSFFGFAEESAKFVESAGHDGHFFVKVSEGLREAFEGPVSVVRCEWIANESLQSMEAAGEGFVKEGDQIASILANFPGNVLHKFSFGLPSGGGEDSGRGAHGLSVEFCGIDESSEGGLMFF